MGIEAPASHDVTLTTQLDGLHFVYSSDVGLLGCWYLLAAVNISVWMYKHDLHSLWYIYDIVTLKCKMKRTKEAYARPQSLRSAIADWTRQLALHPLLWAAHWKEVGSPYSRFSPGQGAGRLRGEETASWASPSPTQLPHCPHNLKTRVSWVEMGHFLLPRRRGRC